MAEIIVTMPQLGESLTEGTITKWLKQVGEQVKEDELLVEIATDKINTEIPSEATGTVTQILAKEGDTIQINQPIAVISSNGASAPVVKKEEAPPASIKAEIPGVAAPANGADPVDLGDEAAVHTGLYPSDPSNLITLPSAKSPTVSSSSSTGAQRWREKSSPLVRSILAEHNLDLSVLDQIDGSGANGRITKEDVVAFITRQSAQPQSQPAPVQPPAAPQPTPQPLSVPAGVPSWIPIPSAADADAQPLAGIRKIIAERLAYSEHTAPHVTTFAEVDVTDLVAFRAKHKQWASDQYGVSLTYLPFVIRAMCSGLKAFPGINASLIGDTLYSYKHINVGIAVSLDQAGLMIPVIRDADRKGVIDLAKEITDLAARARSNQLKPDEMRGSTITLSNPGAFGGWISTPVINQPNAAILNTGTIKKMPWVMPDDSIVARSILFLSLSYDHRIVDGETSVKFLQHVKKTLEDIEKLILL